MPDLLLDTCALIWLAQGGGELGKTTLAAIDEARFVHVSVISAWELGLLVQKKQLELPLPIAAWFDTFCREQNIHVLDLDCATVFAANSLPWHHRDPADRFILAAARLHTLTIVTKDQRFHAYGLPLLG